MDLCHSISKLIWQIGFDGTDTYNTSIDIAVRYRQLLTRYENVISYTIQKITLMQTKKKQTSVSDYILVYFGVWVMGFIKINNIQLRLKWP